MYDIIIVGSGYAGSICARKLAEETNKKILLIDKRNHIAGNMYDEIDSSGILIHKYGPHISVMNEKKSFDFLSRFTEWVPYHHTVNAQFDNVEVPLPFNLTAIDLVYDIENAIYLKQKLIDIYGKDTNIAILDLMKTDDLDIKKLSNYIYEKIFLHYTMKMWGLSPNEIDPSVTARIPIRLSYDNRHFLQKYQVMPKYGYTKLFKNMLDHPNIDLNLNTNFHEILSLDEKTNQVLYKDSIFNGLVIYTGALDELFHYKLGVLPYRSLNFKFKTYEKDYIQNCTTLNWPDERLATRRTEMKRLTGQIVDSKTTVLIEYPGAYEKDGAIFNEPYYPIINKTCKKLYNEYKNLLKSYSNIKIVGRLADYKYYNMESTILKALEISEQLINNLKNYD